MVTPACRPLRRKKGCVTTKWACNDDAQCTTDCCDPKSGCTHGREKCDDKDACTVESCLPDKGCGHKSIVCDDGNVCTKDACDKAKGCVFTAVPDAMPCVAGPCNTGNCKLGLCAGVKPLSKPGCPDKTASPSCKELLA